MMCAMCGKDSKLVVAIVEGTELKVCDECARFGKVLRQVQPEKTPKQVKKEIKKAVMIEEEPEIVELVVEDYAKIIRDKRETMGLKQAEFAKMVNEKESLIQNIEQGKFTPSLELARKFEKTLKITLIEEYEEKKIKSSGSKTDDVTLGDLIKIKRR